MTINDETRVDGQFCWMDIKSHQPKLTADFFAQTLSWKASTDLSSWRMATTLSTGPYDVSGLSDLSTPVYPPGLPAHVAYYLATDNVDHVVSDAESAGAEILVAPFDAGGEGRVATVIDPFGAPVSLIQRARCRSWSHPRGSLGTPISLRHTSDAPDAAHRFYTDILRVNDTAVQFAEFDSALPPVPGSIPGWTAIITVPTVTEVTKIVATYGGGSVTTYDGNRPLMLLTSPDGVRLGLMAQ